MCSNHSRVFPTGEPGIFYEDLYDLVKPLHEVSHPLYLAFRSYCNPQSSIMRTKSLAYLRRQLIDRGITAASPSAIHLSLQSPPMVPLLSPAQSLVRLGPLDRSFILPVATPRPRSLAGSRPTLSHSRRTCAGSSDFTHFMEFQTRDLFVPFLLRIA